MAWNGRRTAKTRLFKAQRGKCFYCGVVHPIRGLEIDHKYPQSRSGGNEIGNLQLLCKPCNMRKGIQSDEEFRRRYNRLLPANGGIPHRPIPQADFSEETQYTRAPREVRAIYHKRFSAYRKRQQSSQSQNGGCGLLVATMMLIIIALALLSFTY